MIQYNVSDLGFSYDKSTNKYILFPMKFELKTLVGASLSETAVEDVNSAMAMLVREPLSDNGTVAKLALQRHLFDLVPEIKAELEEP